MSLNSFQQGEQDILYKEHEKLQVYQDASQRKIDEVSQSILKYSAIAWSSIAVGVLVGIGSTWFHFSHLEQPDRLQLGELGSLLAGTVGVVWSLAGLFFIYLAFLGQKQQLLQQSIEVRQNWVELKATREELRGQKQELEKQSVTFQKQSFENTFFQMLSLHHQIVNDIELVVIPDKSVNAHVPYSKEIIKGRKVFVRMYDMFKSYLPQYVDLDDFQDASDIDGYIEAYYEFYIENQAYLSHYFTNLYNILKFINSKRDYGKEEKLFYTNLVRAQLSSHELLLLFYNCLSKYHGREKFKPLIEEFHLLQNLPEEHLFSEIHATLYKETAYKRRVAVEDN